MPTDCKHFLWYDGIRAKILRLVILDSDTKGLLWINSKQQQQFPHVTPAAPLFHLSESVISYHKLYDNL